MLSCGSDQSYQDPLSPAKVEMRPATISSNSSTTLDNERTVYEKITNGNKSVSKPLPIFIDLVSNKEIR